MRKSVHFRMVLGAGGFAANPDGPLPVEFCKRTIILGSTLLANDVFPPSGATIVSVSAFVGGVATLVGPDVQWDDDGLNGLTPALFNYTIQDNTNPLIQSTATVTLQPFFPVTQCVDDGPGGAFQAFDFTPKNIPESSMIANDTFGGATSPPPNTANPITVTVLQQTNPPYVVLFDSNLVGGAALHTFTIPVGVNNIEVDCFGAQGGAGGDILGVNVGLPGGFGGGRQVTNYTVTTGEILSIGVGRRGLKGTTLAAAGQSNIGTGGVRGKGFSNGVGGGNFGFPDGFGGNGGQVGGGQAGGRGQVFKSCITGLCSPILIGAGGGGGAGSAVTFGDATIIGPLGPLVIAAGGGGGGGGLPDPPGISQGPGFDGGPPLNVGTGNDSPLPPGANIGTGNLGSNGTSLFASNNLSDGSINGRGGGGGGYRGGTNAVPLRGFGGENGDRRVISDFFGKRILNVFGFDRYQRTTITDFPSTQVGDGRVIIRGRFVQDTNVPPGQDFPVNCDIVDLGANIQVTTNSYASFFGTSATRGKYHYFITDTKTGFSSTPCEVEVTGLVPRVVANDKAGPDVTELVSNFIARTTIVSGDTFPGGAGIITAGDFEVVSATNCTAVEIGNNVRVIPVARAAATSCSFVYRITDPNAPVVDGQILGGNIPPPTNRATDTATITMTINLPTPTVGNDAGPAVTEELGQGAASVLVSKASLLVNDNCGSLPCTFSTSGLIPINNCVVVSTAGANVEIKAAGPASNGTCRWQYRVQNAQGVFSNFATVTHTVNPVVFGSVFNAPCVSGGNPIAQANANSGSHVVPAGMTLMKTEVWGAQGGDGGDVTLVFAGPVAKSGGAGGLGGKLTVISTVTPGEVIQFACGGEGRNGGNSVVGCIGGGGGGAAGLMDSSGVGPNQGRGWHLGGSCPLVSDGGIVPGGFNVPAGGIGNSGVCSAFLSGTFGGGGGGGAGSAVWRSGGGTGAGQVPANIIATAGGGGGGGGGSGGTGTGGPGGQSCKAGGRNPNTPFGFVGAQGGGGGGFRGGDRSNQSGLAAGGLGGGGGFTTGQIVPATDVFQTGVQVGVGRVRLSFA